MNLNRFPTGCLTGEIIWGFITVAFSVGLIALAYPIRRFFEGRKHA